MLGLVGFFGIGRKISSEEQSRKQEGPGSSGCSASDNDYYLFRWLEFLQI